MRCSKARKQLSAYLDGELQARRAAEVRAHLQSCERCTREAEQVRTVWRLLDHAEELEPSRHFATRFWQRVRRAPAGQSAAPRQARRRFLPRWASALTAAAVALIALSLYVAHMSRPSDRDVIRNLKVIEQLEAVRKLNLEPGLVPDLDVIENLDILENLTNGGEES